MTDTPKFEVIDRRKYKAEEEEREASASSQPEPASEPAASRRPSRSQGRKNRVPARSS